MEPYIIQKKKGSSNYSLLVVHATTPSMREFYCSDLNNGTFKYLNEDEMKDYKFLRWVK